MISCLAVGFFSSKNCPKSYLAPICHPLPLSSYCTNHLDIYHLQPPLNSEDFRSIRYTHMQYIGVDLLYKYNLFKVTNTPLFYLFGNIMFVYFVGNSNCPWNVTQDLLKYMYVGKNRMTLDLLFIPYSCLDSHFGENLCPILFLY